MTSQVNQVTNLHTQNDHPCAHHHVYYGRIYSTSHQFACIIYQLAKHVSEVVHDKIWVPNQLALENRVKSKFDPVFIDRIKHLCGIDQMRLFKHLDKCTKDEELILKTLQNDFQFSETKLQQILAGAHVRLNDNGKIYHNWVKKMSTKKERDSSHPSDDVQYGIEGPFVKEFLFSKFKDTNGQSYTWFQFENHPMKFGFYIRHMLDYVKYKLSGHNQGPYGNSPWTDKKPLILKPKVTQ